jgi:hypothetical protein
MARQLQKIVKTEIAGDELRIGEWLGSELRVAIGADVEFEWVSAAVDDAIQGLLLCT